MKVEMWMWAARSEVVVMLIVGSERLGRMLEGRKRRVRR